MRGVAIGASMLALLAGACGRSGAGPRTAEMGALREVGIGANADPTVRPARLFPEVVDSRLTYGAEAGGGSRAITAGLRVVTSPGGAIVAAPDRLPTAPQMILRLPERLGGGFLFVIGTTIWRADRWLDPAKPIFTAPAAVQEVVPGLDRVYVRSPHAVLAIDGKTGQVLDLGPWPSSPYVASYAAADGWRAAAVTDMRGVVATFDAGASWRPIELPMDAKQVVVSSDSLAIGGFEAGKAEAWYELRSDGSITRLGAPPHDVKSKLVPRPLSSMRVPAGRPATRAAPAPVPSVATGAPSGDKEDFALKTFGKRPVAAAIEDGWPLKDGTAIVAREGALARVRLADGALVDVVRDAFPLKTARCHPVPLARARAAGAFGFVCGEPRGTTAIYAYEPARGGLLEIKRFDKPRVVTSSGNGALAVRGPCAEDGEPAPPARPEPARLERIDERSKKPPKVGQKAKDEARTLDKSKAAPPAPASTPKSHPYCVFGHDDEWREIHVRGDIDGERVVVLADGRIVVVSPPQGVDSSARLTILGTSTKDGARATTVPVTFPRVTSDVGRVLRLGLWLDGFEERRPGVVGGWIEAGGVMLGVELELDGKATVGQFIRDAGTPFVSGRYGLGWTTSRRGYETTDGGMTWVGVELPEPLVPIAKVERRACGPVGCLAHGWLRVGWGATESSRPPPPPPPPRSTSSLSTPHVQLACEPLASLPPAAPPRHAPAVPPPRPSPPRIHFGGFGGPPVLGSFNGLRELPPFFSQAAPTLRDADRGINVDVRDLVDRHAGIGSLARVYGWGPRTGEWDTLGRWQVKWLSPFAGWTDIRASLPSPPPQMVLDMTRVATGSYGYAIGSHNGMRIAPGDDPAHALLIGKRLVRSETVMFELEADRSPVEVRRADGEPFGEIESAVRTAGRWFVTTPTTTSGGPPVTVVWQIESGIARELVRVPRTLPEAASSSAHSKLSRRSDGRAIALVVDGEQTAERAASVRWALPIDLESGALGEPESLGYVDLAGRTLDACGDELVGWVLDASLPASAVRLRLPHGSGALLNVLGRLRFTSASACIERLAGNYEGQSHERAAQLAQAGATRSAPQIRPGELFVSAMSMQSRFGLRCSTETTARR